jgi:Protein of unknown function (DUF4235)
MKILYKPFALIAGLIGSRIARSLFKSLWSKVDPHEEPPESTVEEASLGKVVAAAALEAATVAAIAAIADRASARTFQHLTGYWPGKKTQDEDG